ncbi:glycosyltransferase involved in cell wall biosynthesis [Nocardioides ginsengisegetis]|uniref:Glycosyltransferase involved in cell wall biosynthesis n=1 Tax=Nocardioides ginsengisegetis TaxID=661491 RepID=A0A7W3J0J7_9ACTN|nr:glycosyltransferase involved in cell wall biosynthesis [Nocardioides ginsengisegetis]
MAEAVAISALIPVHAGVAVEHWEAALDSLIAQSMPADEVVVVEDGPVSRAHRVALDVRADRLPLVRIALPVNRGAGVANQAGLLAASGTWVAKVDSDDVSLPHRFEQQVRALESTGSDVCGTAMLEFVDDPHHPIALRPAPLSHAQIARRMRVNNPINHPSSIFRREDALAAGGYPDLRYMQDYDLFARMLRRGARMMNLAEPLVLFRAGAAMRGRRSASDFTRLEWDLQHRLRDYGIIGTPRMVANLCLRLAFRRLPEPVMREAYARLLSKPVRSGNHRGDMT